VSVFGLGKKKPSVDNSSLAILTRHQVALKYAVDVILAYEYRAGESGHVPMITAILHGEEVKPPLAELPPPRFGLFNTQ
jgi:hypothetical protein